MDNEGRKVAKKINKDEAFKFKEYIINNWQPSSQVWPLKWGDEITSLMAFLNGGHIMYYFRRQLKLRYMGRIACYMPAAAMAGIFSEILQTSYVTDKILVEDSCPLCHIMRAGISQFVAGLAYPLILTPIAAFHVADRYFTYPIPSITRAPKEVFQLAVKIASKNFRPFIFFGLIQVFAASYIAYEKQLLVWKVVKA